MEKMERNGKFSNRVFISVASLMNFPAVPQQQDKKPCSKWTANGRQKRENPNQAKQKLKQTKEKKHRNQVSSKTERNHPLCFSAAHDEREKIYLDKKHLLQTLQA